METAMNPDGAGYWYADQDNPGSVDVLNALRAYRAAEAEMRRRTRDSMKMNETDLLAIRYAMRAHKAGHCISPKDLSRMLKISTASTTGLVDRLVASGHLIRRPHPTDRRSVEIIPTGSADTEVRETLGGMHTRMLEVAESLSTEEALHVTRFLERMTWAVGQEDTPHHP
ncbi:MarR family transcriptional regulator [Arthrobacter sp. Soil782]|uniref:MarR family winged helix-turn-helix transcriptional regulator n=1 Tax=Arthrobacter sp. Soil782 TaxID=1736410 RepID=UPI0006F38FA5|nr:MarR family transcriptional regulator [Arthrobacter sp. Soil782]KRF04025.1 MarR family transcriptional regulator [Arthrobacter sp. Soil782]